ncbi:MAG TPA: metallophosphoesterase [Bryobacteraceae bacterium]|nr:metallophosphoesterase [Bryobacteraceae bacterium]
MISKRSFLMSLALLVWSPAGAQAPGGVTPPVAKDSLRFAAIGDWGTGDRESYETAAQFAKARGTFPFDFVVTLGDNIYGRERPKDFQEKFERPFKPLLDAGVKFYASLGNHDETNQIHYKLFNMNGKRYYTFKPRDGVRFFALDSNYMDPPQVEWLEKELAASGSDWKICFFHHPLYSSGERHGPSTELRAILEPLFVKYGVNLVLSGHEHFYERIKPQRGIYYFISGSGGKLRRGGMNRSEITAAGNDQDRGFVLFEIAGDKMHFQAITRTGQKIDSGVLERPARAKVVSESRH